MAPARNRISSTSLARRPNRLWTFIIVILILGFSVSLFSYLQPNGNVQTIAVAGILGMSAQGEMHVENSTAAEFAVIANLTKSFDLNIPIGDSHIDAIAVMAQADSSLFNKTVYSSAGSLNITAKNLFALIYRTVGSSRDGTISFSTTSGSLFMPPSVNAATRIPFIMSPHELETVKID